MAAIRQFESNAVLVLRSEVGREPTPEDYARWNLGGNASWLEAMFDVSGDQKIDAKDLTLWVTELGGTYPGDANLDGEFDSGDLVQVFQVNEFEDGIPSIPCDASELMARRSCQRERRILLAVLAAQRWGPYSALRVVFAWLFSEGPAR